METFLMIWNPKGNDFWDKSEEEFVEKKGVVPISWSYGKNCRKIIKGSRVFFMRVGIPPKGIFGSGWVTSKEPDEVDHWRDKSKTAWHVDIKCDVFKKEPILPLDYLTTTIPFSRFKNWTPRGSAVRIDSDIAKALEREWKKKISKEPSQKLNSSKALLIAANPHRDFLYGPTIGSISAHLAHLAKQAKVIWELSIPGEWIPYSFKHDIKKGYFYNVPEKAITHVFNIEKIIPSGKLNKSYLRYLIKARRKNWEEERAHEGFYVIIIKLHQLNRIIYPRDFQKVSDNKPVQILRNYCVVYDKEPSLASDWQALPEEIEEDSSYPEGANRKIIVNGYERNRQARDICIRHYGCRCIVCGLSFEETYGEVGKDHIEVHHLRQLSEVGRNYKVKPIIDLRPICPNCHSIIHLRKPQFTPEEIKKMMRRNNH